MTEPLAPGDFWDDFCLVNAYNVMATCGYVCPRCGALVKDVPVHIKFHNE